MRVSDGTSLDHYCVPTSYMTMYARMSNNYYTLNWLYSRADSRYYRIEQKRVRATNGP